MKASTLLLALCLLSQTALSQVTKKVLDVPEFKGIYVNSNYTVYLKQTNKQEVTVEALTEIYSLTEIKVVDGILMVNMERKAESPNKSLWARINDIKLNPTMKVYVTVRNVDELQVNGGGRVIAENSLATGSIKLAVNGGGSMDIDLKGDKVTAEVTGSGSIALRGYATSLDALVSGSGNIHGFNCPLDNARVKVSGAGTAELNVTNTIDAIVAGTGHVKHKGNTKNAHKKVFGSGSVDRAY